MMPRLRSDYPDNWPGFAQSEDMLCGHHACRCFAAAKLAAQGRAEDGIALHRDLARVRCVAVPDATGVTERTEGT